MGSLGSSLDRGPAPLDTKAGSRHAAQEQIERILATTRRYLAMDVAFVGELTPDRQIYRFVDGQPASEALRVGGTRPVDDTYCQRVVAGTLPSVIPDARADERVRDMAVTSALAIGSYIGVPIALSSGAVYGTLCCVSKEPDPALASRDVGVVRVLASLIADEVERLDAETAERRAARARVVGVLERGGPSIAYQPIVDLRSMRAVGFEALARFSDEPRRDPDVWFAEAWSVGLGVELELRAIDRALQRLGDLDARYVSVNASPDTVRSAGFAELMRHCDAERIVIEITEQADVRDPEAVRRALAPCRARGLRLAIDDLGAGYAGLRQLLRLAPDTIKIDTDITAGIEADAARQVLVSGVVMAGARLGTAVVAEGVETEAAFATLRVLGVPFGQGYYLGRPSPLPPEGLRGPLTPFFGGVAQIS